MGEAGRRRWKDCFSLTRVIDEHESLYQKLASQLIKPRISRIFAKKN
jgi:hypothetical protein